jgi:predicted dehydrogenase
MVGAQFAARLHLENYFPLRGSKVEITAVASRTKGRAEELARKYNIAYVADDYRALLDRKDVDAVDLCVPTDLHHEFVIQAEQAGKHVICEKPLTGYFGKERPEDLMGLAVETVKAIYAAYLSAEQGNRVELAE